MTAFDTGEWEARCRQWSDMHDHMGFLRETAAAYAQPVIAEFGTRLGNSTSCFLAAAEDSDGQVWSVDIDPPRVPEHWFQLDRWHFLQAGDTSGQAHEWLPAKLDVLFIDTSHQLDHTLAELRMYVPRVRPGGVVLLHDTEWLQTGDSPDLCRQLDEPGGAVTEALNVFSAETGLPWVNRHGCYGIGIIRP